RIARLSAAHAFFVIVSSFGLRRFEVCIHDRPMLRNSMADAPPLPDFNDPIARHARVDQPLLKADMTVEEALAAIRREGLGERIIYFYAVDEHDRLAGVLPTRRLLTASPDITLRELMV